MTLNVIQTTFRHFQGDIHKGVLEESMTGICRGVSEQSTALIYRGVSGPYLMNIYNRSSQDSPLDSFTEWCHDDTL